MYDSVEPVSIMQGMLKASLRVQTKGFSPSLVMPTDVAFTQYLWGVSKMSVFRGGSRTESSRETAR